MVRKMVWRLGVVSALIGVFLSGVLSVIQPLAREYSTMSQVAVLLFALFSFVPFAKSLGWRRGVVAIVLLGLYAFVVESIALVTHVPYGHFAYSDGLGYKLFDLTPIAVFVSWSPLVIGVYALVQRFGLRSRAARAGAVATGLVLVDLVLDPGAVAHGLWAWEEPGWYYGVPFVNFVGWAVSGFGGGWLIDRLVSKLLPVACTATLVIMLVFWSGVALGGQMIAPLFLGLGQLAWLRHYLRTEVSSNTLK